MSMPSAVRVADRGRLRFSLVLPVIAAYALIAFIVAPDVFPRLISGYARQMILLGAILVVALPAAGILLRPRSPVTMMAEIVRNGGVRLVATVLAFCVGMAAFSTFKIHIPQAIPFYADTAFADFDAMLHGGDPGLLLHRLIPPAFAGNIVFAYSFMWFCVWFGMLGFVALQNDADLRRRYYWTMCLAFILLGTLLATALSSVGPIFYDSFIPGDRFAELMSAVYAGGAGKTTAQTAGYLLDAYHGRGEIIGTGISAMPSMHVAIVTLNALMLWSVNRILGTLGWLYVAVILVGSVYLGWHYAIDGYVSIAVVSLLWWVVGEAVRSVRRVSL